MKNDKFCDVDLNDECVERLCCEMNSKRAVIWNNSCQEGWLSRGVIEKWT